MDKNYEYDGAGNMISDASEQIGEIRWDNYGKIREIVRANGASLQYHYDAMGNRIVKVVKNGEKIEDWVLTYYVRDASGNVMATYEALYDPEKENINQLYEREHHIYGSSRLGIKASDQPDYNLAAAQPPNDSYVVRKAGHRRYELSNHLGNVLSVVSDNKVLTYQGMGVSLYKPEILSYSDYYPFGWAMPDRADSDTEANYRYGFNGKEKDDDVKGEGVQYDYGFRIYDARIARFLSVDPLARSYPMLTPYQFAGNTPIAAIDVDGLEGETTIDDVGKVSKPLLEKVEKEVIEKTASYVDEAGKLVLDTGSKSGKFTKYLFNGIKWTGGTAGAVILFVITPVNGDQSYHQTDPHYGDEEYYQNLRESLEKWTPEQEPTPTPPEEDNKKDYYIHYSDNQGISGIGISRRILPNKKGKVYLTKLKLTPEEVENLLYLGIPEYKGNGDNLVIFKVDIDQEVGIEKVSELEYTYNFGSLKIRPGNLIYIGPNTKNE